MTPHSKSSSGGCEKPSTSQLNERPRSSSSDAKLPASNDNSNVQTYSLVRCKSDTTQNKSIYNNSSRRQLQTITSGIALDEMKPPTQSLPPLSPSKGYHSPQCPYYGSPLIRRKSLPHDSDFCSQSQCRRSPPQVIQGQQLPPCIPNINSDEQEQYTLATHRSSNSHSSFDPKQGAFMQQLRADSHPGENDSDSAVGSQVDSIVFHYNPGMEVPPAEYALPASILKVYGVDCECMGSPIVRPERMTSSLTNSGCEIEENYQDENVQPMEPQFQPVSRYELLPPERQYQEVNDVEEQQRILPYHERKRLSEIKEREEKKIARKESKLAAKSQADKTETSLLSNRPPTTKYDYENNQAPGFRLLGQLASLISGKLADHVPGQEYKQYGSIEDESKQYRDKGKEFIQKTQKERTKFRQQCKSDELNNVTIPVSTLHGP